MAQIGRARGSGSRGRRFESCHSDHMSHRGTTPRDVTYHPNLPIRNLANSQNWQGLRKLLCQPCSSIGANRGSESCHGLPLTAFSQTEVQNPVTDNPAALTSGPSRTPVPTMHGPTNAWAPTTDRRGRRSLQCTARPTRGLLRRTAEDVDPYKFANSFS